MALPLDPTLEICMPCHAGRTTLEMGVYSAVCAYSAVLLAYNDFPRNKKWIGCTFS